MFAETLWLASGKKADVAFSSTQMVVTADLARRAAGILMLCLNFLGQCGHTLKFALCLLRVDFLPISHEASAVPRFQ